MTTSVTYIALKEAALTATDTSTEVDLGPYINVGHQQVYGLWGPGITGADTDETYACKITESATTVDSDFADVTGGGFTSLTQESTIAAQMIKFVPKQRYVKAVHTLAGTTPAITSFVGLVLMPRFDT